MNDASGIVQVMKYPVSFIALEYAKCEKHVNLSKCDQHSEGAGKHFSSAAEGRSAH
jgi:hypothetical protein